MLQNATPLRKSAPWPPNISDEMSQACHRFAWQGAESLAPAMQNHIWTFKSGPPSLTHSLNSLSHPSLTHTTLTSLTDTLTHSPVHAHTYTHTNSPTITPSSLLSFLFPSCFSMLSLSLEKLVTCGVIRSYNVIVALEMWFASQRRAIVHLSSGQMAPHPPL